MSFMTELQRLGAVEKFKTFCATTQNLQAMQQWSRDNGIDAQQIPKDFKKIRRQLGVAGTHGGRREGSGKPGVVRVRFGQFVRPHAPGTVNYNSHKQPT